MERFDPCFGKSQFVHLCFASSGALTFSLLVVTVISVLR